MPDRSRRRGRDTARPEPAVIGGLEEHGSCRRSGRGTFLPSARTPSLLPVNMHSLKLLTRGQ